MARRCVECRSWLTDGQFLCKCGAGDAFSAEREQRRSKLLTILNSCGDHIRASTLQTFLQTCESPDACKTLVTSEMLLLACKNGWLSSIKVLLRYNPECINNATALHSAVQSRSVDCVEYLLKNGGDPTLKDSASLDAPAYAVKLFRRSTNTVLVARQAAILRLLHVDPTAAGPDLDWLRRARKFGCPAPFPAEIWNLILRHCSARSVVLTLPRVSRWFRNMLDGETQAAVLHKLRYPWTVGQSNRLRSLERLDAEERQVYLEDDPPLYLTIALRTLGELDAGKACKADPRALHEFRRLISLRPLFKQNRLLKFFALRCTKEGDVLSGKCINGCVTIKLSHRCSGVVAHFTLEFALNGEAKTCFVVTTETPRIGQAEGTPSRERQVSQALQAIINSWGIPEGTPTLLCDALDVVFPQSCCRKNKSLADIILHTTPDIRIK